MKSKERYNIKQAVILAGGLGTRLRPFTDTSPKPMYPFNGKPFLQYIIEMLAEQGFKEVLLLLGYLPEKIMDYFKDGSKWNISIKYSVSPVENLTGKRLHLVKNMLDDCFMLMYCDNYWPIQKDKMTSLFARSGCPAMVTVYSNTDNYTKSNLVIDDDGLVRLYDKTRTAENLQGVDIGFVLLDKRVVNLLNGENQSFEKIVYPRLIEQGKLKAYITGHRYYSIGSHERMELTGRFLARKPAIILDRDGVLNKKAPKAQYICSWDDWKWMDGAVQAVSLLKKAGYTILLVTNQAGIARKMMTENDLQAIHNRMLADLRASGADIDKIYYCPHGWNENCTCRKPQPGMLFQAQRDFSLDLSRTFFVGDDQRDAQAADLAGAKSIILKENQTLLEIVKRNVLNKSE